MLLGKDPIGIQGVLSRNHNAPLGEGCWRGHRKTLLEFARARKGPLELLIALHRSVEGLRPLIADGLYFYEEFVQRLLASHVDIPQQGSDLPLRCRHIAFIYVLEGDWIYVRVLRLYTIHDIHQDFVTVVLVLYEGFHVYFPDIFALYKIFTQGLLGEGHLFSAPKTCFPGEMKRQEPIDGIFSIEQDVPEVPFNAFAHEGGVDLPVYIFDTVLYGISPVEKCTHRLIEAAKVAALLPVLRYMAERAPGIEGFVGRDRESAQPD